MTLNRNKIYRGKIRISTFLLVNLVPFYPTLGTSGTGGTFLNCSLAIAEMQNETQGGAGGGNWKFTGCGMPSLIVKPALKDSQGSFRNHIHQPMLIIYSSGPVTV
jgi:hypothetical protein